MRILIFLNQADKEIAYMFLGALVVIVVLFILLRELNLWYFRINEHIRNQNEIIRLLRKIAGEKIELDNIKPGDAEYDKLSQEDKAAVYARHKLNNP